MAGQGIAVGFRYTVSMLALCALQGAWAGDEAVLPALAVAKNPDATTLELARQGLQGSVLAYYPDYLALARQLDSLPPDSIIAFAQRYPGSALAEKLAADYAEVQAARGQYAQVRQVAAYVSNPDLAEECALVQAQVAGGDALNLAGLKDRIFLNTEKIPDSCASVETQLLASALTTPAERLGRLFVLLRTGQPIAASETARTLGLSLDAEQLAAAARNPDAQMQAPIQTREDQMLFLAALKQITERSPSDAQAWLNQKLSSLPEDVQRYGWRMLALSTMGRYIVNNGHDSRTTGWFDRSTGLLWSDEEAIAYARAAIRDGAWNSLLRALDAMRPELQQQREWQYWFARASEQKNDPNARAVAQRFYQTLAAEQDYYGLLARDRLGIQTTSAGANDRATEQDRQRLAQDLNFQRAFALRAIGAESSWATREWNWAVRQASLRRDDGLILAAAEQADLANWHDRAIYAVEKLSQKQNALIRFPMPHHDEVLGYSSQVGLDPAWAYGLMRQESRFVTTARSSVGAGGLMQIMPDTARWVARKLGETYSASRANQMDTNIRYGTFYLNHILGQLGNQPVLATAGYNAGPRRAERWRPSAGSLPADQYTESIPFTETRDYVKNVMTNAVHYALLIQQRPQSLGQRMGEIRPTVASAIEGP